MHWLQLANQQSLTGRCALRATASFATPRCKCPVNHFVQHALLRPLQLWPLLIYFRHHILRTLKYWNVTTLQLHHFQANCSTRQLFGVHVPRTTSRATSLLTALLELLNWTFAVMCRWSSMMNLRNGHWKMMTSYRLFCGWYYHWQVLCAVSSGNRRFRVPW